MKEIVLNEQVKEQSSKELYEFLSEDTFMLEKNENGTLTEYLLDENGNKDRVAAVYDNYHEALMSWYDDERRILVDTKKILLSEEDYELLGLLNEYKDVKAAIAREQQKAILTGKEMETMIRNSNNEYNLFTSEDEYGEIAYYQYFINSDGEFEENIFRKNKDGQFYLYDGGVYDSLEGVENFVSFKKVDNYEIVAVIGDDITSLQDYLVEYNKVDDNGKVIEHGLQFVNEFVYDSLEENMNYDLDLGLIVTLDNAMRLGKSKISIHDVSETLKEIAQEIYSSDFCMAFYDLEDCEELLGIKDDEALDALRDEIERLGIDSISVGSIHYGEQGYDVITAYAATVEFFDYADKQEKVQSLDKTVKDAEFVQKADFNKETVMINNDGKEER